MVSIWEWAGQAGGLLRSPPISLLVTGWGTSHTVIPEQVELDQGGILVNTGGGIVYPLLPIASQTVHSYVSHGKDGLMS